MNGNTIRFQVKNSLKIARVFRLMQFERMFKERI